MYMYFVHHEGSCVNLLRHLTNATGRVHATRHLVCIYLTTTGSVLRILNLCSVFLLHIFCICHK